jgi:hypothetical protein
MKTAFTILFTLLFTTSLHSQGIPSKVLQKIEIPGHHSRSKPSLETDFMFHSEVGYRLIMHDRNHDGELKFNYKYEFIWISDSVVRERFFNSKKIVSRKSYYKLNTEDSSFVESSKKGRVKRRNRKVQERVTSYYQDTTEIYFSEGDSIRFFKKFKVEEKDTTYWSFHKEVYDTNDRLIETWYPRYFISSKFCSWDSIREYVIHRAEYLDSSKVRITKLSVVPPKFFIAAGTRLTSEYIRQVKYDEKGRVVEVSYSFEMQKRFDQMKLFYTNNICTREEQWHNEELLYYFQIEFIESDKSSP